MGESEDVSAEIDSALRRAGLRATPAQMARLVDAQRKLTSALDLLRVRLDEVDRVERD